MNLQRVSKLTYIKLEGVGSVRRGAIEVETTDLLPLRLGLAVAFRWDARRRIPVEVNVGILPVVHGECNLRQRHSHLEGLACPVETGVPIGAFVGRGLQKLQTSARCQLTAELLPYCSSPEIVCTSKKGRCVCRVRKRMPAGEKPTFLEMDVSVPVSYLWVSGGQRSIRWRATRNTSHREIKTSGS